MAEIDQKRVDGVITKLRQGFGGIVPPVCDEAANLITELQSQLSHENRLVMDASDELIKQNDLIVDIQSQNNNLEGFIDILGEQQIKSWEDITELQSRLDNSVDEVSFSFQMAESFEMGKKCTKDRLESAERVVEAADEIFKWLPDNYSCPAPSKCDEYASDIVILDEALTQHKEQDDGN